MAKRKSNKRTTGSSPKQPKEVFVDDAVKDYDFANYVRVSSYPHGVILYFGNYDPVDKEFRMHHSVSLPFDVAKSLSDIIRDQLDKLEEKGLIKIVKQVESK